MTKWLPFLLCAVILINIGSSSNSTRSDSTNASLITCEKFNGKYRCPEPRDSTGLPQVTNFPLWHKIPSNTTNSACKPLNTTKLIESLSTRIEPTHHEVHDQALLMVAKFSVAEDSLGHGGPTIRQICSIYDYLKNGDYPPINGWQYVNDPRCSEYFNYANKSVNIGSKSNSTGAGDCDDFAVLMASFVESIGGTTQIVLAFNNSIGGHAYAEVYLGNLNSSDCKANEIIYWLKREYNATNISIDPDKDTRDVWLNLDWGLDEKGCAHPGGPFFPADQKIVLPFRNVSERTLIMPSSNESRRVLQSSPIPLNITINVIASNTTDILYNKGIALGILGKYEEAIASYEAINLSSNYSEIILIPNTKENYEKINIAQDIDIELNPMSPDAYKNKGWTLSEQGNYDEAMKLYDKAIDLDSNNPEIWNNKGWLLCCQKKYNEAIKCFNKAIDIDPNYALAWNNKGWAFYNLDKYDEAMTAYNRTLEIDPGLAVAWNNKGLVLFDKLKKYDEAIEAYNNATECDPSLIDAWKNKYKALMMKNRPEEAKQAQENITKLESIKQESPSKTTLFIYPKRAMALNNKGWTLYMQGKYDEAIKAYDEAIKFDPRIAEAWNNKGWILYSKGMYDKAINAYEEAIKNDPELATAWKNKGEVLKKLNRNEEAKIAQENAERFQDQQDAKAWNDKGWKLFKQGEYNESIKSFNDAIKLNYNYSEAWNNKGWVLCNQSKYNESLQSFNRAIEIDPQYALAWNNKGWALYNLHKYDEAMAAYDKSIEYNSNLTEAWNNRGWLLYNQGIYEEAIKDYDKAIEGNSEFAAAWYNKGLALKELGRIAEADASFTKAKELGYKG